MFLDFSTLIWQAMDVASSTKRRTTQPQITAILLKHAALLKPNVRLATNLNFQVLIKKTNLHKLFLSPTLFADLFNFVVQNLI